jgi:tripartite-type tricarboxylate transporter receptor subunit TctC
MVAGHQGRQHQGRVTGASMAVHRRSFLRLAAGAAVLPAVSLQARAQAYPARPITFVVPFAAGGPVDAIARIMAESMRALLGQAIVIENVVGAGGSIGTARVARAAPDGYTIAIGNWGTHVVNGAIYTLPYDLLKDFEPVAALPLEPLMVDANRNVAANDLRELIAWLKANPGKASAATSGVGGPSHVAGLLFQNQTGTRFQLVPYRGGGPAMQDLVAGQVDLMLMGPSLALPQRRGGKIKIYAVTAKTRSTAAPEIPTVDEAGLPGFHVSVWHGLWAPKGTPKDIVERINAAAVAAQADAATRRRLLDLGLEIPPPEQQTPDALGALQRSEIERWWPIVKAANIKAE